MQGTEAYADAATPRTDGEPPPAPPEAGAWWTGPAFDILSQAGSDVGVAFVDARLRLLSLNARCSELLSPERTLSLIDLFKEQAAQVGDLVAQAIRTGEVSATIPAPKASGRTRDLSLTLRPLAGAGDRCVVAVLVKETGFSLEASGPEGDLRHVLDALSTMAFVLDEDGSLIEANAAALMAANLQPTDVIGRKLEDTYWWSWDPEAQARLSDAIEAAKEGQPQRYRERIRVAADRRLTIMLQVAPMRDASGRVSRLAASAIDVSELVEMQERQELLAAELTHRVKNILAIVQALVSRAARRAPTKEALVESLKGRIAAMATAVSQLSLSHWTGYDLRSVLAEQMGGYGSDRMLLDGPVVQLSPKAAMAFALIAYELASNAAKHGALAVPEGRVNVRWRFDDGELDLEWREVGGEPIQTQPSEVGFGSTLVRTLAEGDLGASLAMEFPASGATVRMKAPVSRLQQPAEDSGPGFTDHAGNGVDRPLAGRRVLVAEESPVIALDVASVVQDAGGEIIGPFSLLDEAVAAIEQQRADIVILNVEMSSTSAMPTARATQARGAEILFSTTGENAEIAKRAFPRAILIAKPFLEVELMRALVELAQRRDAHI